MDTNMQLTINSFRQLFPWQNFFPDTSLTFSKIPDISLTAVKFPDISRFSRQVVTLFIFKECVHLLVGMPRTEFGVPLGLLTYVKKKAAWSLHKCDTDVDIIIQLLLVEHGYAHLPLFRISEIHFMIFTYWVGLMVARLQFTCLDCVLNSL